MFNYAAEYAGATATQHGLLYTLLPFIALLAKPVVCSIADRYAAHHHCLLMFIGLTIIGFGSLAIYPFFGDWTKQHQNIVWILYCLAAFLGNTSMCVVNSIGDSLAINSCQRKEISYGEYRLWGPVGFGIFGAIWGIANEIPFLPKYTPGILTMVAILTINNLLIAFWYDKEEFKVLSILSPENAHNQPPGSAIPAPNYGSTNQLALASHHLDTPTDDPGEKSSSREKVQERDNEHSTLNESRKIERLTLLARLIRQDKTVLIYIFIFTFCGIMTGIHWQFFFKYLEKISQDKFFLIATLALPVQALGGELVFFMLSGKILMLLGASMTLVVCLLSFAARYLLYAYLVPHVNIYWVLLVELLQGPAFGLMYCVLTHQANVYSEKIDEIVAQSSRGNCTKLKKSLHATLQGILGASFEGLGLGLGAIIGGSTYDADPILMWQIAGYSALCVGLFCLAGSFLSSLMNSTKRQPVNLAN